MSIDSKGNIGASGSQYLHTNVVDKILMKSKRVNFKLLNLIIYLLLRVLKFLHRKILIIFLMNKIQILQI